MYILGFIVLFLIIGFLIGLFAREEGVAYGLILIITIAWAFIFGPWAIATFIELAIGYSLGAKSRPIAGDALEKAYEELQEEQEEPSNLWLWLLYGIAGSLFLLTQIANFTNTNSDTIEEQPIQSQQETKKQPIHVQRVAQKHPFAISTSPSNARVRIMNIRPKYRHGIELEDGAYDVLVDATGYHSWRQTIQHTGRATYQEVTLKKKSSTKSKVKQDFASERPKDGINASLIAERYRDNRDGTVTDIKTNLQWMRCSVGLTWNGKRCSGNSERMKWKIARELTISFAGYNDWRLPTIGELRSLVYCSNGRPSLYPSSNYEGDEVCGGVPERDHQKPTINRMAFPDTPAVSFWSITTIDDSSLTTWSVNFMYGSSHKGYTFDDYKGRNRDRVRLVRKGF